MTELSDLKLYSKAYCPFCDRVDAYLVSQGVRIEHIDAGQPENREELIRLGGKGQVPALLIDGSIMYESSDIIDYLAKRLSAEAPELEHSDDDGVEACVYVEGKGWVCPDGSGH